MFCSTGCGNRAIGWKACYNDKCESVLQFTLCDEHAGLYTHCAVCGSALDSGLLPPEEPLLPPENKHDKQREKEDEREEPRLPSLEDLTESCNPGLLLNTQEMAVTIKVCNGFEMTDVVLGHSFHAMRAAEKALRKQCGISISNNSASGMNIALMELRLLLVDKECNIYQIGVELCDAFSRNVLLCSTGGVVLTEDSEITRLEALVQKAAATPEEILVLAELKTRKAGKDKLVRCCATQNPYGGSQLFALCGAYSFFDSEGKNGEDLEIAAVSYQQTHDGNYRKLVNGSNHDQLFHHSEQTGFKMLFENPDLLVRVLNQARDEGFLPDITLSLKAVSVDIFTTRSACLGCMNCSLCVLASEHFFDNWLDEVENAFGGEILIDDARKLVRFDCAVPFKDELPKPKLGKGCFLLHGAPRSEQGAEPPVYEDCAFKSFRLRILCNANDNPLLDSGSHKQYIPKILYQIKEEMNIAELPKSIGEIADVFSRFMKRYSSDLHSGIVAASFMINKFCAGSNANALIGQLKMNAGTIKMEVDEDLVKLAVKYYQLIKLFQTSGVNIANSVDWCGLVGCASIYFGAPEFGRTFLKAFSLAYYSACDQLPGNPFLGQVYHKARELIMVVVKKLMQDGNATAESAARLLALHYDVLADYKNLLE